MTLLEELLGLVAEGGAHSYAELATQLAVTQPFLESMLEDLARLGYLERITGGCDSDCASCPIGGCSISGQGRLWSLTAKGASAGAEISG